MRQAFVVRAVSERLGRSRVLLAPGVGAITRNQRSMLISSEVVPKYRVVIVSSNSG
jgi:orotidine-5'-phosphate decarboxylase